MFRNKQGSQYFTLVGGKVADGESTEQGLIREVKEETGLDITSAQLVFTEEHPEPYNQQYMYLCAVAPHAEVALDEYSEEYLLNQLSTNIHEPLWVTTASFERLPFRTPSLQAAIVYCLRNGFPAQPVSLTDNTFYIEQMQRRQHGMASLPKRLLGKLKKS